MYALIHKKGLRFAIRINLMNFTIKTIQRLANNGWYIVEFIHTSL